MKSKEQTSCKTCNSHGSSIFCDLHGDDLGEIDAMKTVNTYKKNQVLFYEGNDSMGIFCILKGRVKLYKSDSDGHHKIVKIMGPGEITGYRAVIAKEPCAGTAEAIEDTTVCFVDKDCFLKFLAKHPDTGYRVMANLASDLGSAQSQEITLVHKSVKERFAELLLSLDQQFGIETENGRQLDISLTRQEIADLIGTTLESAIRTMSDFRKKGLIAVDKRSITISDFDQITELANRPV
jgi:CRP/FNR family transcriptional regulator